MVKSRSLLLDIFRVILCMGVLVYHYTPERPSSGPYMVNGFFVMSGFFAGLMILQRESFVAAAYYSAKVRRLVPLMLVGFLLGYGWHWYLDQVTPCWTSEQWGNFSLVAWVQYYNPPMWYMVVEWYLLLTVPLLYWLSTKKYGIACAAVLSAAFAIYLFRQVPPMQKFSCGLYFSPVARCWQFVAGIVAAKFCLYLKREGAEPPAWVRRVTWPAFAVFVSVAVALMLLKQESQLHFFNYSIYFDLLTTAFYVLLIPCLYLLRLRWNERSTACVTYLAALTYPVYLVHVPLLYVVEHFVPGGSAMQNALLATLATAVFSAVLLKADARLQQWWKR